MTATATCTGSESTKLLGGLLNACSSCTARCTDLEQSAEMLPLCQSTAMRVYVESSFRS